MSLNEISKDVISKAHKEKEIYSIEHNEKMSQLEIEYNKNISEYEKKLKDKFDLETYSAISKIKGKAQLEAKKLILDTKSQIFNEVWIKSFENLKNLEKNDREKLLLNLIKIAKKNIKFDNVYCNEIDIKFLKSKLTDKKIYSKDILGLIFESKSGEEILDLTYNNIATDIFDKYEDKISEKLFR